jgi:hypothetical protein
MVMKLDRGRSRFGPDLSLQLAFPFISPWTLDSQLMYLNTLGWNLQLSFFSFLVCLAHMPSVLPLPCLDTVSTELSTVCSGRMLFSRILNPFLDSLARLYHATARWQQMV